MGRTKIWGVVLVLGLGACGDGLAPKEYRGEPLMSLNGVVTSSQSKLTQDLMPAVVIMGSPFLPVVRPRHDFMRGEVQGAFPSAFTLRLYDAPPAETLDALIDGEPAMASGTIVAVSRSHPAWLQETEYEGPVVGASIGHVELCSPDQCITGSHEDCFVEGEFDPKTVDWPCGWRLPAELPWNVHGYAHEHEVVYFAGPVAAGSVLAKSFGDGRAIAAGYHVVQPLTDLPQEDRDCYFRARDRAFEEHKQRIGDPDATIWNHETPEDTRESTKMTLLARIAENCRAAVRIVDTSTEPVKLAFEDEPSYRSGF